MGGWMVRNPQGWRCLYCAEDEEEEGDEEGEDEDEHDGEDEQEVVSWWRGMMNG